MTATVNITIQQGVTFRDEWVYSDDNGVIDLTGYTARMKIKTRKGATTTLVELTTENGGITLGGVAGTITFLMSATATAALDFDVAVYDLELIVSGVVTRLAQGNVLLDREVTV